MKTGIKALLLSTALLNPLSIQADDDFGPMMGDGYGYGMMGGGYGYGIRGQYGPGMMQGYGYGPRGGYGPGMMHGYGYGYGPGMMGAYGMGPINLSKEQIEKMQTIRSAAMDEMSTMMNKLWKARNKLSKAMQSGDDKAINSAYDEMASSKKQAFMYRLKMREKMQSVLTKEQKEAFRNGYPGMMMDY